jgi:hypothetical protein
MKFQVNLGWGVRGFVYIFCYNFVSFNLFINNLSSSFLI